MLSSNRLTRSVVVAVAAAVVGVPACGGEDEQTAGRQLERQPRVPQPLPPESPHPVTTAVQDLRRAFLASDYEGICARMTAAAKREAGSAAHSEPTTCVPDVRKLFGLIEKGDGWRNRGEPRVTKLTLEGDQATATVALGQQLADIPFVKEGGEWKLNGFFGGPLKRAESYQRRVQRTPFPAAQAPSALGDTTVEVRNRDDDACPDLSEAQFPVITGGCKFDVSSGKVPLTMSLLTIFGDFQFERCRLDYRVYADGAGRTWIDRIEVNGDVDGACGDVNACYSKEGAVLPWKGRLRNNGDGSFIHRIDMCLRTCVGSFTGDLVVRMAPEEDGWRAEPLNGGGQTGFRFDGPLAVADDSLDVRATGS